MSDYGCQQILINSDKDLEAILIFLCEQSAKLWNCGTYYSRQLFFKTNKIPHKYDLHNLFKGNKHFQAMYSHVSQQCLTTVAESFNSFLGLLKAFREGKVSERPRLPGYRKGGLAPATFPRADVKFKDGMLRFPLGSKVKTWFGIDAFYLPMPTNLNYKDIREIRILPRNQCFYAEFVYKMPKPDNYKVNKKNVLGIDPGLNNWLTCVSNVGTSFIIDGKHLKSLNQYYNKRVSTLKDNKPPGFWSKQLAHVTEKRNRQVRDAVNKAARKVIRHCLENQVGTVIFGWNKENKQEINLGSKNNQKFVQVPTARLKNRIEQLCKLYNIEFVQTEESYTSKCSFLDNDLLPKFGEKPVRASVSEGEGWKPSGTRVTRGLYKSANGTLLNADANGAANIIRKVAVKLGLNLGGISRVSLIAPLKVRLWTLQESPSF